MIPFCNTDRQDRQASDKLAAIWPSTMYVSTLWDSKVQLLILFVPIGILSGWMLWDIRPEQSFQLNSPLPNEHTGEV